MAETDEELQGLKHSQAPATQSDLHAVYRVSRNHRNDVMEWVVSLAQIQRRVRHHHRRRYCVCADLAKARDGGAAKMIMRMMLPRLLPWIIGALSITAVVGFLVNRGYNWGITKGQEVIKKFDGDTRKVCAISTR
jgi:hypothetical protein